MIVCFVDMGGINDHHCLNFLFIMMSYMNRKCMSLCYPWQQLQLVRRHNWNFKSIVPSHEGNLAKVCWNNQWGEYLLHWKQDMIWYGSKQWISICNIIIYLESKFGSDRRFFIFWRPFWIPNGHHSKPKWSPYGEACLTPSNYPFPLKSFHFWIFNHLFKKKLFLYWRPF